MTKRVPSIVFMLACTWGVIPSHAQSPAELVGQTVRITAPAAQLSGAVATVDGVVPEGLIIRRLASISPSPAERLRWSDILRLDIARGRHSRWRAALIWGGLAGVAAAVTAGSVTRHPSDRERVVPLAGWIAFGVGATIGAIRDPTRWRRVMLAAPGEPP